MAEIYQLPSDSGSNAGMGNIPFSIPIGGFGGGLFGNGGYGMNGIADLFGLAIIASMFGWGNGGFGGGFGNNTGGAAFLSNQLANDSGRDLIMQAVTNQGEASRTAIQTLSTMLGQDFNLTNAGIQSAQNTLNQIANQLGMSTLQMINAVQSGDAAITSTLQSCCCQTQKQIMAQGYENQIRTIEQTGTLSNQANVNTAQIRADIAQQTTFINEKFCDLEKRELQDKITTLTANNALLRSQIDNANQTAQITSYVNSVVAPLQKSVTEIENKMPNTVPITWPNLTAVNTTPYVNGGFYGNGWYGNGFGNNIVF